MRKLAIGVVALLASLDAAAAADPTGEWVVDGGYARVRIENCSGNYWGVVAWEKTPGGTDKNNPEASKRTRPTLGLPIMIEMKPTSSAKRWDGEIYNTEDGRTYSANISLSKDDVLRVQGCVLGILCGGQDWTRYKEASVAAPARPVAARGGATHTAAAGGAQAAAVEAHPAGAKGKPQASAKGGTVTPAGRETTEQLCARVSAMQETH